MAYLAAVFGGLTGVAILAVGIVNGIVVALALLDTQLDRRSVAKDAEAYFEDVAPPASVDVSGCKKAADPEKSVDSRFWCWVDADRSIPPSEAGIVRVVRGRASYCFDWVAGRAYPLSRRSSPEECFR
jgi:hypothetical protein